MLKSGVFSLYARPMPFAEAHCVPYHVPAGRDATDTMFEHV